MNPASFEEIKALIQKRLNETFALLEKSGIEVTKIKPLDFFLYLSGETFTGDKTTIDDILKNKYYLIHEVIEIGELIKNNILITLRTVLDTPKENIYEAHFVAFKTELELAELDNDWKWIELRLGHLAKVIKDDPWMPETYFPVATKIYDEYEIKLEKASQDRKSEN